MPENHPIEPEPPWPKSPSGVEIRCHRCGVPRRFADQHAPHLDSNGTGPRCAACGRRIEYRCTECGERWHPLP
ncbi:hypothetical protein [Nocardiopsis coralliicola]